MRRKCELHFSNICACVLGVHVHFIVKDHGFYQIDVVKL